LKKFKLFGFSKNNIAFSVKNANTVPGKIPFYDRGGGLLFTEECYS
jgi:hypothetical protein